MNDVQKSIAAAAGIVLACLSVRAGSALRDRADFGTSNFSASASRAPFLGLEASQDSSVNVPAADYYGQMVSLLKQYYVEPIKDDEKMATGSVRGMIASLGDSRCLFMDATQFKAYVDRTKGVYAGIGVDLFLDMGSAKPKQSANASEVPEDTAEAVAVQSRFPKVTVCGVVPGSPADKAGVKPGDVVTDVDGHWIPDDKTILKFRQMQRDFLNGKIKFNDIAPFQKELRVKTERAILPFRAMEKLLTGTTGPVDVVWTRDGDERETKLTKEASKMPGPGMESGAFKLPITSAGAEELSAVVATHKTLTIDLRDQPEGDYEAMARCLRILAPTGVYGEFTGNPSEQPLPLKVMQGNPDPPKLTLVVDRTTRGPAEILAWALTKHGRATMTGSETGHDLTVKQAVELPDGSGYDLVTGEYKSGTTKDSVVAMRGSVR